MGCIAMGQAKNLVLALGSILQYTIKACAVKSLDRSYKNRKIYILSDLVNMRSPQNWSGITTNPSYNSPDITEFNQ
jgi:hypothetical protein